MADRSIQTDEPTCLLLLAEAAALPHHHMHTRSEKVLTILDCGFLATTLAGCSGEHSSRLASELARGPQAACCVKQRLHLGRHAAKPAQGKGTLIRQSR